MTKYFCLALLATQIHAAPAIDVFEDFESDGYGEWVIDGPAFGLAPNSSRPKEMNGEVRFFHKKYYATSSHGGDLAKGSLTSPNFKIAKKFLNFLISGGNHPDKTACQLLIDGKIVKSATGQNSLEMRQENWDLSEHLGKTAQIRLLDAEEGSWGIINVDFFTFSDEAAAPLKKSEIVNPDGLVSTDVLPGVTVPKGAILDIFADTASSQIASPTALSVDEEGRVFVAETHRFRYGVEDDRENLYWYIDDLASKTNDDRRAMHEKWKAKKSIESLTKISEKIRVLVDEDHDGKADKSVVYADGFNNLLDGTAAGVMAYNGTVYFACIPHIWALKDKDGDLVSDERVSIQDGFGVHVSLSGHDLNGFAIGPDGRIYATIGDRAFNSTTKESKKLVYHDQGAILRFEPDGSNLEVVHAGLRNPKEIAFDQWGNGISVDNNSDQGDESRVIFMMEGADSGWRIDHQALHTFHRTIGIEERPINRWMQEKMWQTQNDEQPLDIVPPIDNLTNGPSGLAYYPGTGFDLDSKNRFLITDYKGGSPQSGIYAFGIKPKGAGFAMIDAKKFNWGVGVTDVEWGYDGKVYITDFINGWESHNEGRVITLRDPNRESDPEVAKVQETIKKDFSEMDSQALAKLLTSPDQRIRLRAQIALAEKPDALVHFVAAANQTGNLLQKLHGVWGLGMLARKNDDQAATEKLFNFLKDESPLVRAQTATMLGESTIKDGSLLLPLLNDENLQVRSHAALAIARKPLPDATEAILTMLRENEDKDPYIRHAGVMALLSCATSDQIAAFQSNDDVAVRIAAVVALQKVSDPRVAKSLFDQDPRVANQAIRAIHDNPIEKARPALAALLDDYAPDGEGRKLTPMLLRRLCHSAFRIGGEKNIKRLVEVAANEKNFKDERLEALRLLSIWTNPPAIDQSLGRYAPLDPRDETAFKNALAAAITPLFTAEDAILEKTLDLVSQYHLSLENLDSATLQRLVGNAKFSGSTRAVALQLLADSNPENLSEILKKAAADNDDKLASTALALSAKLDPAESADALANATESDSTMRRQEAWKIMASLPAAQAVPLLQKGLQELTAGKGDTASTMELLDAARARDEETVKKAVSDYEASLPKDDRLAKYLPTLAGGDPVNGEKLFKTHPAQCMRCHRAEDGHVEGGDAGPSLVGVAKRHDARGLLEAMILPSATIAPSFGTISVKFKNGTAKSGLLYEQNDQNLTLIEGDKAWKISKADVATQSQPISPMPPMEALLQPKEMRDLIAWLLTLDQDSANKAAPIRVEDLDPTTLESKKMPAADKAAASAGSEKTPDTKDKVSTEATPADAAEGQDPILVLGEELYNKPGSCVTCHQAGGAGIPGAFPPLANSEWVTGPAENLIRIQLRGLMGEIKVGDAVYNGAMPSLSDGVFPQTNENIAAVLTYVRHTFGAKSSPITTEMVAKFETEKGQGMLTAADLIDPLTAVLPAVKLVGKPSSPLPSDSLGAPTVGIIVAGILVALIIIAILRAGRHNKA